MTLRLALAVGFIASGTASAQGVFKFKVNPGDKLQYQSQFECRVETKAEGASQVSVSKLGQIREWHVVGVDKLGVATMELTVLKMSMERTDPDGKKLAFDSTSEKDSDEQLWKQLSKAVGKPIMRVQMAANGVVKDSKNLGETKALFQELPFQVTVPDEYPREGLKWQREFPIAAETILGKGEALQAVQICRVEKIEDDRMTVASAAKLAKPASDATAKIALAQFLPTGKVTLDLRRGVMVHSDMNVREEVPEFDGPGTHYSYTSRSVEKLLDKRVEAARKD
jgi:hypothetical protein